MRILNTVSSVLSGVIGVSSLSRRVGALLHPFPVKATCIHYHILPPSNNFRLFLDRGTGFRTSLALFWNSIGTLFRPTPKMYCQNKSVRWLRSLKFWEIIKSLYFASSVCSFYEARICATINYGSCQVNFRVGDWICFVLDCSKCRHKREYIIYFHHFLSSCFLLYFVRSE